MEMELLDFDPGPRGPPMPDRGTRRGWEGAASSSSAYSSKEAASETCVLAWWKGIMWPWRGLASSSKWFSSIDDRWKGRLCDDESMASPAVNQMECWSRFWSQDYTWSYLQNRISYGLLRDSVSAFPLPRERIKGLNLVRTSGQPTAISTWGPGH